MTKKTRFEVFKRDGFACGYCGRRPPEVVLEVDHITPVSKGGKDRITNLLTSCFDCNRGKAGTPVNKQTHQEAAAVLKEKRDQLRAYNRLIEQIEQAKDDQVTQVESVFIKSWPNTHLTQKSRSSVRHFIDCLGADQVLSAVQMASQRASPDDSFRYLCGICWNWIKGRKPRRQSHE